MEDVRRLQKKQETERAVGSLERDKIQVVRPEVHDSRGQARKDGRHTEKKKEAGRAEGSLDPDKSPVARPDIHNPQGQVRAGIHHLQNADAGRGGGFSRDSKYGAKLRESSLHHATAHGPSVTTGAEGGAEITVNSPTGAIIGVAADGPPRHPGHRLMDPSDGSLKPGDVAAFAREDLSKEIRTGLSEAMKYLDHFPLFEGGYDNFVAWKKPFLMVAKQFNIFDALTSGVDIPVADVEKPLHQLREEGFSAKNIVTHLTAWNTLAGTIKAKDDQDILQRMTSPAAAWRELVRKYSSTTIGTKVQHVMEILDTRVNPSANPVLALEKLKGKVCALRAAGLDMPEELVCVLFLLALPREYAAFKKEIQREQTITIDQLDAKLRVEHDSQKQDILDRHDKSSNRGDVLTKQIPTKPTSLMSSASRHHPPKDQCLVSGEGCDTGGGNAFDGVPVGGVSTPTGSTQSCSTQSGFRDLSDMLDGNGADPDAGNKNASNIKSNKAEGHWEEKYHPVTGAKSWFHTGTKITTTIDPFY